MLHNHIAQLAILLVYIFYFQILGKKSRREKCLAWIITWIFCFKSTFYFLQSRILIYLKDHLKPICNDLLQLYSELLPETCEVFRCLCTGEMGANEDGVDLSYEDSQIHRIVKSCWVQGGGRIICDIPSRGTIMYEIAIKLWFIPIKSRETVWKGKYFSRNNNTKENLDRWNGKKC